MGLISKICFYKHWVQSTLSLLNDIVRLHKGKTELGIYRLNYQNIANISKDIAVDKNST